MKPKHSATLLILTFGWVAIVLGLYDYALKNPKDSKEVEKVYVLPLVEDMATNPNPLQF
jgi:hypothetical protein